MSPHLSTASESDPHDRSYMSQSPTRARSRLRDTDWKHDLQQECTDPSCVDCGPLEQRVRRPSEGRRDSGTDISTPDDSSSSIYPSAINEAPIPLPLLDISKSPSHPIHPPSLRNHHKQLQRLWSRHGPAEFRVDELFDRLPLSRTDIYHHRDGRPTSHPTISPSEEHGLLESLQDSKMPRASKAEPREEQEVSTSSADEPPIVLPNKNLAASGPLVSTAITIVTSSAGRQIIGAGDGSKSPRRERFDSSVVSAVVDAIPDVVSGEAQKSIDPPGAESSTSMRNGELEQRADGNAARALERLATLSIQDTRPISGVIGSVCVPPHPEFDGNISDVTRHLNTLGSVDTVHDSDEASDLCNVDVDTALQSAMSVVKNLLLRQLMDCTSSYAMDSLNETNIATSSKADRSSISSSGSSTTNSHTTSAGKRTRKRERRPSGEDGDDDDEEEDEDDRPKKRSDGDFNGRSSVPHMRLKCPFYQRQPEKYTKSACSHSEYPDMPRLKQHIRRVHTLPPKCPRCKQKMASVEACDKHLRAEPLCEIQLECPRCQQNMASAEARDEHLRAELICENKNELQGDLIDPQVLSQELNLRRKAYSTSQTIEDQWTTMFKALFGDQCSVPSPYGQSSISPQLEQALCEALVDILSVKLAHIMGPIMTEIKGCLPDIIESCRQKLKGSPSSNARDRRRTDSATSSSTKDLVEKPSTPELDVHPEQEPTTPSAISVVDNVPTIHPQHLCLEDDDIDHGVQTINPSILGYHSHDCYNVPGSNVVLEGSQGSATSAPVGVQPGTFQPTLDFTSIVAPFTQGSMFDPYSVEGGGLLQPLLSSADSLDPSFAAGDTEWDYTNPVQVQSGVANPEAMEQLNWETWPSLLN